MTKAVEEEDMEKLVRGGEVKLVEDCTSGKCVVDCRIG